MSTAFTARSTCQGLRRNCLILGWRVVTANKHDANLNPPDAMRELRAQRQQAVERSIKKQLVFDIAKLHRRELRVLKSARLQQLLGMSNQWHMLEQMSHTPSFDSAHSILLPIISQTCWKIFFMDIQVIQPDHFFLHKDFKQHKAHTGAHRGVVGTCPTWRTAWFQDEPEDRGAFVEC